MEWMNLGVFGAVLTVGLLVGYALGARRARRVKSRVLLQLNEQSLELLDTKSSLSSLKNYLSQHERKDRLLKLSLRKLQESQSLATTLSDNLHAQRNRHFIELSRLRLLAVESRETALKTAAIARKATTRLKLLEAASSATQTIEAHEPKSYGSGAPVSVSVSIVDQARLDAPADAANPVSTHDSARLSKLHSSNEATASL